MKKVIQDQSKCIGCMACVGIAPAIFAPDTQSDRGIATIIDGQKNPSNAEIISKTLPNDQVPELLAGACCGAAITIETAADTSSDQA